MANIFLQPCDEGVIRSRPAAVPCARAAEPWILAATILGSSMTFIDGTVVNVALPALQKNLNATVLDVQWVVESYALFLAALLLVGGSLGDRYGRRLIFCIGTVIFALASIWCGATSSIEQLILARGVQGVGGALLVPGSLAIISSSFDEGRRGWAIGTWSSFSAMTAAVGPLIGGWLIEHISWRAIFFMNVPLALLVLLISFRRVPESRSGERDKSLDWLGAGLATLGLGGVVYGLIESSRLGFTHPPVLAALLGGALSLAAFLGVEARSPNPMLPLSLFHSRRFSGANLMTLFLYAALGGAMFFLPLNLIQVQSYSATAAGAAWLPFILIMSLLSRWSGGLVKSYGARLPLVAGPLVAGLGFLLFMLPDVGENYWTTFFPAMVVLGLGMAVSVAPLTTTVMNGVDEKRAGIASGINNAVARTAGLLGIAIFGIVILNAFNHRLDLYLAQSDIATELRRSIDVQRARLAGAELPPSIDNETRVVLTQAISQSFVFGFRLVMATAAGLALASALIAFLMIEGKTLPAAAMRASNAPFPPANSSLAEGCPGWNKGYFEPPLTESHL
ncbi:MAG: MFS transporter [Acidobacteria bacterium]|nr:MFS transporter [Acidobacteriota bacterium]